MMAAAPNRRKKTVSTKAVSKVGSIDNYDHRDETTYYNMDEREPIRENMNWGRFGRFNIDPSIQARFPNHVLSWIVYSRANEEDRGNYEDAIGRRYMPVLKSEVPEYDHDGYLSPFDQKEIGNDQLIRRGGQILMKRLEEHHKAENEYWNNQYRNNMDINNRFLMEGFRPSLVQQSRTVVPEADISRRFY